MICVWFYYNMFVPVLKVGVSKLLQFPFGGLTALVITLRFSLEAVVLEVFCDDVLS